MHHKHKRTVRKEVKRYDHKSARAKEKTALDGGHPGQARGMHWSNSLPQPPIIDEVGLHKSRKKKASPKKEKCPVNGTHEWYREWTTVKKIHVSAKRGYWDCQDCRKAMNEGFWYDRHYCLVHEVRTPYEIHTCLDTCIHCWKERTPKAHKRYSWGHPYRMVRTTVAKPRTAYRRPKG